MAITNLPQPPERGVDSQSTFVTKAEAFFDSLKNVFVGEMNTEITNVNNNATSASTSAATATTKASEASASAASALAASNSKGAWSALTGALNIPASVTHNGKIWVLNTNLADVTLSEPTSINTDWTQSGISQSEVDLKAPIASPTFTGTVTAPIIDTANLTKSSYTQIADASLGTGTHTFDYSLGDMQQLTATGNITIAFSNMVSGKVCSFIIDAVDWGAYTITLPVGMLFDGATAPTFTASGMDRLVVIKDKDDVYSMFIVGQGVA